MEKTEKEQWIAKRIQEGAYGEGRNCAQTALLCLAERFQISVEPQLVDAAAGLYGAGGYGAQCGLVEGGLMFLGIYGAGQGWSGEEISRKCFQFAQAFEERFGGLTCRVLRPEGFAPEVPLDLCDALICRAIAFTDSFIRGEE